MAAVSVVKPEKPEPEANWGINAWTGVITPSILPDFETL